MKTQTPLQVKMNSLSGYYLCRLSGEHFQTTATDYLIIRVKRRKYKLTATYRLIGEKMTRTHNGTDYFQGVKALSSRLELIEYYPTKTKCWADFTERFFEVLM